MDNIKVMSIYDNVLDLSVLNDIFLYDYIVELDNDDNVVGLLVPYIGYKRNKFNISVICGVIKSWNDDVKLRVEKERLIINKPNSAYIKLANNSIASICSGDKFTLDMIDNDIKPYVDKIKEELDTKIKYSNIILGCGLRGDGIYEKNRIILDKDVEIISVETIKYRSIFSKYLNLLQTSNTIEIKSNLKLYDGNPVDVILSKSDSSNKKYKSDVRLLLDV